MFKQAIVATIFVLMVASMVAVSAETGYVEQIGRSGDVILYRLVETNKAVSDTETTIGYVRARGSYHLPEIIDAYTHSGFHRPAYTFVYSYKDYTGKQIPFVIN